MPQRLGPRVRIQSVQPLDAFHVHIEFEDGIQKDIDLEPYLHGPIFESIRNNPDVFRSMRIEAGAITWENGADIDPDVLYYDELKPVWMEEPQLAK